MSVVREHVVDLGREDGATIYVEETENRLPPSMVSGERACTGEVEHDVV